MTDENERAIVDELSNGSTYSNSISRMKGTAVERFISKRSIVGVVSVSHHEEVEPLGG